MQNPTVEMLEHFYIRTEKHRKYVMLNTKALSHSAELSPDTKLNLLLRGIRHDLSKYAEGNLMPYAWIAEMYRCKRLKLPFEYPVGVLEATNAATLWHITNESHHPEYWTEDSLHLDPKDRDKSLQPITSYTMPEIDILEMCCDWTAMGQELESSAVSWADANVHKRWKFNQQQTDLIYKTLEYLEVRRYGM